MGSVIWGGRPAEIRSPHMFSSFVLLLRLTGDTLKGRKSMLSATGLHALNWKPARGFRG